MKTRTKLEVKSQRPKRYIRSDAGENDEIDVSWFDDCLDLLVTDWAGRTDAESEEEE